MTVTVREAIMLRLDCGAIEPTIRGFLDAAAIQTVRGLGYRFVASG